MPVKKPIDCPSGEKKGADAPLVPGRGRPVSEFRSRIQSCSPLMVSAPTYTIREPSRDSAKRRVGAERIFSPAGNATDTRTVDCAGSRRQAHIPNASAATATAPAPSAACRHGPDRAATGCTRCAAVRAEVAPVSAAREFCGGGVAVGRELLEPASAPPPPRTAGCSSGAPSWRAAGPSSPWR